MLKKIIVLFCCLWAFLLNASQLQSFNSNGLDAILNEACENWNFSGVVGIAQYGDLLYSRAFGNADQELQVPNTVETVFNIASITKSFTAASILQLQENGLLSVQDPLSKFFPELRYGSKITLHQLLTHTTGIPDYAKNPNTLPYIQSGCSLEFLISLFIQLPLEFEPGFKYSYSSSNYILLGAIIEKVSGESYEDYIQHHLFGPAGMHCSSLGPNAFRNYAQGYTWDAELNVVKALKVHPSLAYSTGGICSTLGDMILWDRALFEGGIISSESLCAMTAPHVIHGTVSNRFAGYGFFIEALPENGESLRLSKSMLWHKGSMFGYRSMYAHFPEDQTCIVILSNCDTPSDAVNEIALRLADALFCPQ